MERLPPINNTLNALRIRQLVAPSKIQQIRHPPVLSKLASSSRMLKGKEKPALSSNDWWPPHSPKGHFSNLLTKASHIKDHLTRAEAAKYYPNGFPKDWKDSPQHIAAHEAEEQAAQAKAAERMVADLTREKSFNRSRALSKKKKAKLDSYMQTISESPPATPRLQHVLPVPVPNGGWPLLLPPSRQNTRPATPKLRHARLVPLEALPPASYLIELYTPPYTPTHKPRKPRVAHKHPSLREKNGSPLKQSWVLPESDNSSGEDQLG